MKWILIFVLLSSRGGPGLSAEFEDFKACDAERGKLLKAFPNAYVDCTPKGYDEHR